jgi:hypothetical protein
VLTQSTAGQVAGDPLADLELVNYGAGHAWLRRELDAAIRDADQVDRVLAYRLGRCADQQPDEVRYTLTPAGPDYLARERALYALFGPWPTCAEACRP